jgi:hypothetical protein
MIKIYENACANYHPKKAGGQSSGGKIAGDFPDGG